MASGNLSSYVDYSKGSNPSFNDGYGNSSKNDDKVEGSASQKSVSNSNK